MYFYVSKSAISFQMEFFLGGKYPKPGTLKPVG
jgi:hypothetical protein